MTYSAWKQVLKSSIRHIGPRQRANMAAMEVATITTFRESRGRLRTCRQVKMYEYKMWDKCGKKGAKSQLLNKIETIPEMSSTSNRSQDGETRWKEARMLLMKF